MKKAVILHGTDGNPEENWFPWLRRKLEGNGYEVWIPQLPECHTPNRNMYADFLLESGWDFTDNIVVGHSSGAVEVLNILNDDRFQKVTLAVMIGAWAGGKPNGYDTNEQFENLFPPQGFNFETIKTKADKLVFLHGSEDPWCPLEQAEFLAKQTDSEIHVVENGGHLGKSFTELPELWQLIEPSL